MPSPHEFASLSRAAQVARVRELGQEALRQFGVEATSMKLLVHAENTTFKVASSQGVFNLRVQRPGYQTTDSTRSELQFLEHLRGRGLPVPEPVHAPDGRFIVSAAGPKLEPRNCELFRWIDGRFLRMSYLPKDAFKTGQLMARLHLAARDFRPPSDFERHKLDEDAHFGPKGDWFLHGQHPFMNPERQDKLKRMVEEGRAAMRKLGRDADVYGLIHADLHHGNLVWNHGEPSAIDFDDTGWAHYLYDFAAALAFGMGLPRYPEMQEAMFAGYEQVAPLPPYTRELINSFLRVRYFGIIRWIVERQDNPMMVANGEAWISRWMQRVADL